MFPFFLIFLCAISQSVTPSTPAPPTLTCPQLALCQVFTLRSSSSVTYNPSVFTSSSIWPRACSQHVRFSSVSGGVLLSCCCISLLLLLNKVSVLLLELLMSVYIPESYRYKPSTSSKRCKTLFLCGRKTETIKRNSCVLFAKLFVCGQGM